MLPSQSSLSSFFSPIFNVRGVVRGAMRGAAASPLCFSETCEKFGAHALLLHSLQSQPAKIAEWGSNGALFLFQKLDSRARCFFYFHQLVGTAR